MLASLEDLDPPESAQRFSALCALKRCCPRQHGERVCAQRLPLVHIQSRAVAGKTSGLGPLILKSRSAQRFAALCAIRTWLLKAVLDSAVSAASTE